jgi:hypothetical protein
MCVGQRCSRPPDARDTARRAEGGRPSRILATALEASGRDSPEPGVTREWTIGALTSDPENVAVIDIVVTARGSEHAPGGAADEAHAHDHR